MIVAWFKIYLLALFVAVFACSNPPKNRRKIFSGFDNTKKNTNKEDVLSNDRGGSSTDSEDDLSDDKSESSDEFLSNSVNECDTNSNTIGQSPVIKHISQSVFLKSLQQIFSLELPSSEIAFSSSEGDISHLGKPLLPIDRNKLEDFYNFSKIFGTHVARNITLYSSCTDSSSLDDQQSCAEEYIQTKGRLLFRRSLNNKELEFFMNEFNANSQLSFTNRMNLLTRKLITDPNFIYVVELGGIPDEQGMRKLTDIELATRIAHMLTGSNPSDELLTIAEKNQISNPKVGTEEDAIAKIVRDLVVKNPDGLIDFFMRWSSVAKIKKNSIEKDVEMFPHWDMENTPRHLHEQAKEFFSDLIEKKSDFMSLYKSNEVPVNLYTYPFYGLDSALYQEEEFINVKLDSSNYQGVLTLPAVIALNNKYAEQSEVFSGLWVREKVFCDKILVPPVANFDTTVDRKSPACAGCHKFIDDLGLSFHHFDATGRFAYNQLPSEFTGELVSFPDGMEKIKFKNLNGLGDFIANSVKAKTCLSKQYFRFSLKRTESEEDKCSIEKMTQKLESSGYVLIDLPVELSKTKSFRYIKY